jgi:extradiol dioxygenase family protein
MHPLLLGFRHVALNVRNVRESVEFYCSVLVCTSNGSPTPITFI